MFNGSNRPTKNQIFGPSNVGGTLADSRERQLYMTGEGLGSFFGSLFRKIIPAATKTIKKIAGSKIVKDTGKQLLNSGVDALTNVAADAISGEKTASESMSDELAKARKDISSALKNANKRRQERSEEETSIKKKKRRRQKSVVSTKKKKVRRSIFDKDE